MRKLFFIPVLVLILDSSIAQRPHDDHNHENMPKVGVITGKVRDAGTDAFIEYSTVSIFSHRDSSLITGTITDQTGSFILKELPYGFFYVEFGFIGYKKHRVTRIRITPNASVVDLGVIKLEPTYTSLEQVEVVADKPHVEYKIDRKVITVSQDISSAGGTAVDVLENTPSVQTDLEGNITLRGSSNFRVLVDGKPSVIEGNEALQQIPASSIQSIEIITNPSAKYDPDGMAGIINILMKKQKQHGFGGIFNASIGTKEKYRTNFLINYRKNNINFFGGLSYDDRKFSGTGLMNRESYLNDTVFYVLSDGSREFRRKGFEIKGGFDYSINDKHLITLSGSRGDRGFSRGRFEKYHEYSDPSLTDQWYNSRDVFEVNFDYYGVNFDHLLKFDQPGHELLSSVYYRSSQGRNTSDMTEDTASIIENGTLKQRSGQDEYETELRIKADYTKPFHNNGKFEAGYQARIDICDADYVLEDYDYDQNLWLTNGEFTNEIEVYRNIQDVYGMYSDKIIGIDYQLGLRIEYTDRVIKQVTTGEEFIYNKFMIFPTAHLTKQFENNYQVLLSYSRRINRPRHWHVNPFTRYIDRLNKRVGNPELEPEFTDSYELNFQKHFGKSFVALETYYRQTNNKITRIRIQDTTTTENVLIHTMDNVNRDYALGAELMANLQIFKWWNINTSANFFNYRIEGEIVSEDVSQMKNTWNFRGNTTFRFKWGSRIQLTGFYSGPSVTAQGEREAFYTVNAALRQDFMKRKLSLTLQIRDIFKSGKFEFTTRGEDFYIYNRFTREPQVVTLSLTYRLNNIRQSKDDHDHTETDYGTDTE
ncbi:MAG: TonB-dependent receptor [Bacteroidales bacterium]|nr:MAG: TonB-dependent receptor [Bacteroidales bacterium]